MPITIWSALLLVVVFAFTANSTFVASALGRLAASAMEPILIVASLLAGFASVVWWRVLIFEIIVALGFSAFLYMHNRDWWARVGYSPDIIELVFQYFVVAILIGSIAFVLRKRPTGAVSSERS